MKTGLILFLSCFLNLTVFGQTAPEKVAAAYCECSKTNDISGYVRIFRAGDKKVIAENKLQIDDLFWSLKRCAKSNVILTPEENKKVPENEITDALNKNCPDVNYFMEQARRMAFED